MSNNKTGIIIQARMGSSRLPGKILMQAAGKSFLLHQIERLRKQNISLFIATTNKEIDQPIVTFCEDNGLACYRGSEENVLSRYAECANKFDIATVVRVTSDCPLIDPDIIANGIKKYELLNNKWAYVSNAIERTYPRGFDFEIFSVEALNDAFKNAANAADLEHVTPYIWKNKSLRVTLHHITNVVNNSDLRLTLDTVEDYTLLKNLIENYGAADLSGPAIIDVLRQHPELIAINAHIEQKKIEK